MTIRTKLLLSFGCISLVILALGIVSIKITEVVNSQASIIANNSLPCVYYTSNINTLTSDYRIAELNHVVSTSIKEMKKQEKKMAKLKEDIEAMKTGYEPLISTETEREYWNAFLERWKLYTDLSEEMLEISRLLQTDSAIAMLNGESLINFDIASEQLLKVVAENKRQGNEASAYGSQLYESSFIIVITVLVVVLLISLVLAFWLINTITKSLTEARRCVSLVAKGDFSANVIINNNDEIGELLKEMKTMIHKLRNSVGIAQRVAAGNLNDQFDDKTFGGELDNALKEMVLKLRDIVSNIMEGASNIASASEQVSSGAQQMAQGTQEQASAAEEASSSMEQMSANIQQNAENAMRTEKIAQKSAIDIRESSSSMNDTVAAIELIAQKISIVEEIANKTDLLALNAAVEAARAGEHGKGFAVVAAEVRKLAERSQKAASEINEISLKSVQIAKSTSRKLHDVVPDIEKTSELVQEITASSSEQNAGANQINSAVQQLSHVIQQNASASEEMASSAEELSTQAEQLRRIVGYFKVGDGSQFNASKNTFKRKAKAAASNGRSELSMKEKNAIELKGFDLVLEADTLNDNDFEDFK